MNANSDLIFRSALLEHIKDVPTWNQMESGWMSPTRYPEGEYDPEDVISSIEDAPAVDAVVLPVHVQQIVYADLRPWETTLNVQPFMVTCITVTQNKKGEWTKKFRANWFKDGKAVYEAHDFWFDEIGNRVFFTKEEAEAVLRRADDER